MIRLAVILLLFIGHVLGFAHVPEGEAHFPDPGRRVIQERNNANNPTVSYTRGRDLSGSLEGAGGIGGLLARSHGYSSGNWTTHNFYFADGGGNVVRMVDASQAVVASYRYDPFGNTISQSGTLVGANVYRFSSKEIHANSGIYYYGYRFYDPNLQRWLNQDPLGELGGINLYQFARNSPTHRVDPLGLWGIQVGGLFIGSGSPSYVFDSEVWGETKESWHTGLDVIGTLEPTPIADILNAGLYGLEGDWGNAGISACGMLPYAGDGAKLLRLGRKLPDAAKGADSLAKLGRSGKQAKLRELATDPSVSSADRGWIRQEMNSIERGQRSNIRVPPGKNLAHRRGFEAKKGCGYEHSDLQNIDLHKLQHKHEGY